MGAYPACHMGTPSARAFDNKLRASATSSPESWPLGEEALMPAGFSTDCTAPSESASTDPVVGGVVSMMKPSLTPTHDRPAASVARMWKLYSSPSVRARADRVMFVARPISEKKDSALSVLLHPDTVPHTATAYETMGVIPVPKSHHTAPTARRCP